MGPVQTLAVASLLALGSCGLAQAEGQASAARKLLFNESAELGLQYADLEGAHRSLSQLPNDRFGFIIKPKPKLDCSMILQERQPFFMQNYHCRFQKPLVVPKPDGLTVQMPIAILQLYLSVLQKTNMLNGKQGRVMVHESTDDAVQAGQFAFAAARALQGMNLPAEVVIMQPKQAVFNYLANKAASFDENERLVLVQKGLAMQAGVLTPEQWVATGDEAQPMTNVPAVFSSTVDAEVCSAQITAEGPLGAVLKPAQVEKLLAKQRKSKVGNFCTGGNLPLTLYIGEGTDYMSVLNGAKQTLMDGKMQMVLFDIPVGPATGPFATKAKAVKGAPKEVMPSGNLQEIAAFFAPYRYNVYMLGNPIEPDQYNHQYYPAAVRIDKLFYSPLFDKYRTVTSGATILAIKEDDPFVRYMAHNKMIPCTEECECDIEKYACACAECKKLVVPLDQIPEFQKQLSSISGMLKLRGALTPSAKKLVHEHELHHPGGR